MNLYGVAVDGRDEAAGDQQRDPAAGQHEHEGRDDRLDADHRDEEAVPDAEHERHEHAAITIADQHGAEAVGRRTSRR